MTSQSLAEHPILKKPYPTARNKLIMPHLVNKVKVDHALDKYISEVVELGSNTHNIMKRNSRYGNLVPSLQDKLITVN